MEVTKDYTVHIDSKKRVTLRGAQYQYYNVKEYQLSNALKGVNKEIRDSS